LTTAAHLGASSLSRAPSGVSAPQADERSIPTEHPGVLAVERLAPVEDRALEGLDRLRIGDELPMEALELCKLAAPALRHQSPERRLMIGEIAKGRARVPFLTHKEQRSVRR